MKTLLNAKIKAISTTSARVDMGTVIKETKCYVTVCIPNYYGAGRDMVERLYKRDGAMYLDHMFLSFYVVEEEPTAESLLAEEITCVTPTARVFKSHDTAYSLEYTTGAEADYMRLYFDTIRHIGDTLYIFKDSEIIASFRGTTAYIVKTAFLNQEK